MGDRGEADDGPLADRQPSTLGPGIRRELRRIARWQTALACNRLRPNVDTLHRALRALAKEGFSFWSAGEPFVDVDDEPILANVLRMTSNLVAERHPDEPTGGRIDLMVEMAGFAFEDLRANSTAFRLGGVTIRVAPLEKLLEAKEIAGRPKDIEFLRMHAARFRNYVMKPKPSKSKRPAKKRRVKK